MLSRGNDRQLILDGRRLAVEIERILPEANDMVANERAGASQGVCLDRMTFLNEFVEDAAHLGDVVENDTVSDEVVVLDAFTQLLSVIGFEPAVIAKGEPLNKAVEGLTFIGCGLNGRTQLNIIDVLHEETRSNRRPKRLKSLEELVLSAIGAQLAQDGGGADLACFDREDNPEHIG